VLNPPPSSVVFPLSLHDALPTFPSRSCSPWHPRVLGSLAQSPAEPLPFLQVVSPPSGKGNSLIAKFFRLRPKAQRCVCQLLGVFVSASLCGFQARSSFP